MKGKTFLLYKVLNLYIFFACYIEGKIKPNKTIKNFLGLMKGKTNPINIYSLKISKFVLGLVEGDFSLQVYIERIVLSTQKAYKGAFFCLVGC